MRKGAAPAVIRIGAADLVAMVATAVGDEDQIAAAALW
jgi:hypothetical protein